MQLAWLAAMGFVRRVVLTMGWASLASLASCVGSAEWATVDQAIDGPAVRESDTELPAGTYLYRARKIASNQHQQTGEPEFVCSSVLARVSVEPEAEARVGFSAAHCMSRATDEYGIGVGAVAWPGRPVTGWHEVEHVIDPRFYFGPRAHERSTAFDNSENLYDFTVVVPDETESDRTFVRPPLDVEGASLPRADVAVDDVGTYVGYGTDGPTWLTRKLAPRRVSRVLSDGRLFNTVSAGDLESCLPSWSGDGDSGAPLLMKRDGVVEVLGIHARRIPDLSFDVTLLPPDILRLNVAQMTSVAAEERFILAALRASRFCHGRDEKTCDTNQTAGVCVWNRGQSTVRASALCSAGMEPLDASAALVERERVDCASFKRQSECTTFARQAKGCRWLENAGQCIYVPQQILRFDPDTCQNYVTGAPVPLEVCQPEAKR